MAATISRSQHRLARERANYLCEYCQTAEVLSGLRNSVDHIISRSRGGSNDLDNLCAACSFCNGSKHAKVTGVDPETGQTVGLFHPRQQNWREHFRWSDDGTLIIGLTTCGRATVETLNFNESLRVAARSLWVQIGRHPPT